MLARWQSRSRHGGVQRDLFRSWGPCPQVHLSALRPRFNSPARTPFRWLHTPRRKVLLALRLLVKGLSLHGTAEVMQVKLDTVRRSPQTPSGITRPCSWRCSARGSGRRPRACQEGRAIRFAFPIPCWAMPRWRSTVKAAESWTSTEASFLVRQTMSSLGIKVCADPMAGRGRSTRPTWNATT